MHTIRDNIFSLFLVCSVLFLGTLLVGCGKKSQTVQEDAQDDLFVEVYEYYFPKRIETLALGEMANYKGKGGSPFAKPMKRRRFYSDSMSLDEKLVQNTPGSRRQLLRAAQSAIGTPYVVGGTSPGGFDCSGLVCWAYGSVGVKLPRTAREQSVIGTRVRRVEDMQAGDIVAFRHPRRGYHTGIYVGGGKFIHSPRRKSHVKINSLDDPYFSETFLGARRVNIGSRENLLAQAESRLQEDFPQLARRRLKREDSHFSRNASHERAAERRRSYARSRAIALEDRRERREDRYEGRKSRLVAMRENAKVERSSSKRKNGREREQLVAENRKSKSFDRREDRREDRRKEMRNSEHADSKKSLKRNRHEVREERNHHVTQKNERKRGRQSDADKHGKTDKKRSGSRKS